MFVILTVMVTVVAFVISSIVLLLLYQQHSSLDHLQRPTQPKTIQIQSGGSVCTIIQMYRPLRFYCTTQNVFHQTTGVAYRPLQRHRKMTVALLVCTFTLRLLPIRYAIYPSLKSTFPNQLRLLSYHHVHAVLTQRRLLQSSITKKTAAT